MSHDNMVLPGRPLRCHVPWTGAAASLAILAFWAGMSSQAATGYRSPAPPADAQYNLVRRFSGR